MPIIAQNKPSFGKKNKKKESTSFIQDIINPFINKRKRDKKEKKKRKKENKKTKMNKGLKAMMKKKGLNCK